MQTATITFILAAYIWVSLPHHPPVTLGEVCVSQVLQKTHHALCGWLCICIYNPMQESSEVYLVYLAVSWARSAVLGPVWWTKFVWGKEDVGGRVLEGWVGLISDQTQLNQWPWTKEFRFKAAPCLSSTLIPLYVFLFCWKDLIRSFDEKICSVYCHAFSGNNNMAVIPETKMVDKIKSIPVYLAAVILPC